MYLVSDTKDAIQEIAGRFELSPPGREAETATVNGRLICAVLQVDARIRSGLVTYKISTFRVLSSSTEQSRVKVH